MVHPPSQTVTAKEGESLVIVVEFCAEPRHTKVLWMSEKNVYVPGAEARDGVQALAIEVRFLDSFFFFFFFFFSFLVIFNSLYAKNWKRYLFNIPRNSTTVTLYSFLLFVTFNQFLFSFVACIRKIEKAAAFVQYILNISLTFEIHFWLSFLAFSINFRAVLLHSMRKIGNDNGCCISEYSSSVSKYASGSRSPRVSGNFYSLLLCTEYIERKNCSYTWNIFLAGEIRFRPLFLALLIIYFSPFLFFFFL